MGALNYKNVCPKVFNFCEILKMRKKYYQIREFFMFLFYMVQGEDAHRQTEPQLKVDIEASIYLYNTEKF